MAQLRPFVGFLDRLPLDAFFMHAVSSRMGRETSTIRTDFIGRADVHLWMRFLFAGQVWDHSHGYGGGGGTRRACADHVKRRDNVQAQAAHGLRRYINTITVNAHTGAINVTIPRPFWAATVHQIDINGYNARALTRL
jgi:hypothetical protein